MKLLGRISGSCGGGIVSEQKGRHLWRDDMWTPQLYAHHYLAEEMIFLTGLRKADRDKFPSISERINRPATVA